MAAKGKLWKDLRRVGNDALADFRDTQSVKDLGAPGFMAGLNSAVYGAMFKAMADHIEDLEARLAKRLQDNERRTQERGLAYRGVFHNSHSYDLGDFVTHGGSMWACQRATTKSPTEEPDAWQLAVKRGRDGKE